MRFTAKADLARVQVPETTRRAAAARPMVVVVGQGRSWKAHGSMCTFVSMAAQAPVKGTLPQDVIFPSWLRRPKERDETSNRRAIHSPTVATTHRSLSLSAFSSCPPPLPGPPGPCPSPPVKELEMPGVKGVSTSQSRCRLPHEVEDRKGPSCKAQGQGAGRCGASPCLSLSLCDEALLAEPFAGHTKYSSAGTCMGWRARMKAPHYDVRGWIKVCSRGCGGYVIPKPGSLALHGAMS